MRLDKTLKPRPGRPVRISAHRNSLKPTPPPKNLGPLRGPRVALLPHSARGAAASTAARLSSAIRATSSGGVSSAPLQPALDDEPAAAGISTLLARAHVPRDRTPLMRWRRRTPATASPASTVAAPKLKPLRALRARRSSLRKPLKPLRALRARRSAI